MELMREQQCNEKVIEQDASKHSCILTYIGNFIEVICFDKTLLKELTVRGFSQCFFGSDSGFETEWLDKVYRLKLPSGVTKYDLLKWLKFFHAYDALFSDGKEWCPREQMEYWRDDMQEIEGVFSCIYWEAPHTYHVVER